MFSGAVFGFKAPFLSRTTLFRLVFLKLFRIFVVFCAYLFQTFVLKLFRMFY
jgi:hypothetical protein